MFGDEKHDSWKWMPYILIIGALVFLFFDPLGMEGTRVRYFYTVAQVAPTPDPLQPPPPGGPGAPPIAQPPAVLAAGENDYPNAANTGPRTLPTKAWPQSGNGTWINVGQNADGYIFNGCVRTTASGVKITNSEIRGNCVTAQLWDEGGNGIFEWNTVLDVGHRGASAVGCGRGSRFYRNNIRGGADGVAEGLNCQIIENYIHDLDEYSLPSGGTRNDGVQIEKAATTGMQIQKNTFENTCGNGGIRNQGCAGAVFITNGASGNTVDGNYIKRWDGPTAGFVFHTAKAGVNEIKSNIIECANISGFGVSNGGPSTFTENTSC